MKNILIKPNKENLTTFVSLGSFFIFFALIDLLLSTFFDYNLTGFLPESISFFIPLIFGVLGLHLIRIEFSGNKILDKININFNSNSFNAILSLLVIFSLIKYIPPILNWFIFDADFLGNTKEDCTSEEAYWVFIKVWLNRFVYGMYPDTEQWRINSAFIMLIFACRASFFVPAKVKKIFINFFIFLFIQLLA